MGNTWGVGIFFNTREVGLETLGAWVSFLIPVRWGGGNSWNVGIFFNTREGGFGKEVVLVFGKEVVFVFGRWCLFLGGGDTGGRGGNEHPENDRSKPVNKQASK